MESTQTSRLRYQLVLGKWPVEEVKQFTPSGDAYRVTLSTPTGDHANFTIPFKPDLKPGDLLTIYTELERDAKEDN